MSTHKTESTADALDQALTALAKAYAKLSPQPESKKALLDTLREESRKPNRSVSDDELDWLAAAGTGAPPLDSPIDPSKGS